MAKDQDNLLKTIEDLQKEVAFYRSELKKVNGFLEKMISQYSEEIRLAGVLQRHLNPMQLPNIPGVDISTKFNPGSEKGGDYLDLFEHEDKMKFGVLLSCGSGYTMSALLMSILIKYTFLTEARQGKDPSQFVKDLFADVQSQLRSEDRASLFYGVVDRRNFELKYVLVGDIAAYYFKRGEDRPVVFESSSGKIGPHEGLTPLTHTLEMNPYDRLILCSEGVAKSLSIHGEELGVSGLQEILARAPRKTVHETRNEILFQVEQWSELKEPKMDQTILVLEMRESLLKLAKK